MKKIQNQGNIYSRQTGFTMIELLVVTTIMIVLTAIGMVSYRNAGITSRDARRKADLETVRQALTMYRADEGAYPIGSNFTTMLGALSEYLNDQNIQDPKGGTYTYSSATGATFSLCTILEENPKVDYCLTNL